MTAGQTFPELERRVETLGMRITNLKARMKTEPDLEKIEDTHRLLALESRHVALIAKLAELREAGPGLLARIREEIIVMEDDLAAVMGNLVPTGHT